MSVRKPEPELQPLDLFQEWFAAAAKSGMAMPEAMTLATADEDGRPSARMVLLKGFDPAGRLRFFTNYDSRKAGELDRNPHASLLFWWPSLYVQVRVEGKVTRLPAAESDAYFASRPRLSQLGAVVSPQSRPIDDFQTLLDQVSHLAHELGEAPVPRPANWGGYAVAPESWEFWVGHDGRLHERFVYRPAASGWSLTRLAP
ncbi:pyridoxamine 5'-phosphate oxidase [Nannocystis bainbridge]|uniref:Pyridoxamine 5'-phosphate oxidase n=1 Tax=Nannocystis bainbridge TaxID=2995303 RepID=A0ABT5EA33_9BACT|nr:pyridoxamine 5'-phosphate oxidase [Nannocystis bainbridge]MDC0721742.1 pyridoxamine 5'-phosphate oxidase [Nannocystis bainbridge]